MNKFIKNVGLGVSALAMSFATVAAAPIASLTYAEEKLNDSGCVEVADASTGDMKSLCINTSVGSLAVRKGGTTWLPEWLADKGISYRIADMSIASFSEVHIQSGDDLYIEQRLAGNKAGKTELIFTLDGAGTVLKRIPIEVYTLDYPNSFTVAVGSSYTFKVTSDSNTEITSVEIPQIPMYTDSSSLKNNGDGSYTLTVTKMPVASDSIGLGDDTDYSKGPVEHPMVYIGINAKNKTTGEQYYDNHITAILYRKPVADDQTEANSNTVKAANEIKLSDTYAYIVEAALQEQVTVENGATLILADGGLFVITDADTLREAITGGKTAKLSLTTPTTVNVDSNTSSKMEAELPASAKGARYVDISVLASVNGKTFGKLTELGNPLAVGVDVSSDPEVPAGYVRSYYVVRWHNNVATRLDASYDAESKTVAFDSDSFSTYLIAYEDVKGEASSSLAAPDSGFSTKSDENSSASYVALMALAALATIFGAAVIIRKHHA